MYGTLLFIHSIVRWLVLAGLVVPLGMAYVALLRTRPYGRGARLAVTWGTMASHTQLLVGLSLYLSSPFVRLFWSHPAVNASNNQLLFFSVIHIGGMMTSVVLMTVGSSLARRANTDHRKLRTIAIFWTIALVIILALIPWPWSPLAQRPLLRIY